MFTCTNSDCGERFDGENCPACGWINPSRLREALARFADPAHRQRMYDQANAVLACVEHEADGCVVCPFCNTRMGGALIAYTNKGPKLKCFNPKCPSHGVPS